MQGSNEVKSYEKEMFGGWNHSLVHCDSYHSIKWTKDRKIIFVDVKR
jgi:hypothetical protein